MASGDPFIVEYSCTNVFNELTIFTEAADVPSIIYFQFPKMSDLYIKSKSNALIALYHSIDINVHTALRAKRDRLLSYTKQVFNGQIIKQTEDIINGYYDANNTSHKSILDGSNTTNDTADDTADDHINEDDDDAK
eukprot:203116_1